VSRFYGADDSSLILEIDILDGDQSQNQEFDPSIIFGGECNNTHLLRIHKHILQLTSTGTHQQMPRSSETGVHHQENNKQPQLDEPEPQDRPGYIRRGSLKALSSSISRHLMSIHEDEFEETMHEDADSDDRHLAG
jgi:hypothetical protein